MSATSLAVSPAAMAPHDVTAPLSLVLDIPARFRLFICEQLALGAFDSVESWLVALMESRMRLVGSVGLSPLSGVSKELLWSPDEVEADAPDWPDWQAARALMEKLDERLAAISLQSLPRMTDIELRLSSVLDAQVEARSRQLALSPREYVLAMIHAEWDRQTCSRLFLESRAAGPAVPVDERFFEELREFAEGADAPPSLEQLP